MFSKSAKKFEDEKGLAGSSFSCSLNLSEHEFLPLKNEGGNGIVEGAEKDTRIRGPFRL